MQLTRPFIRLPYRFDAERLRREVEALPDAAWKPHPTGQPGNSAVPLIARGGREDDAFTGAMQPTPHLAGAPYHRQVMATFGEVLARSRLMKLGAGSEVGLHVDFNHHWHTRVRLHVPILTNPQVAFRCGEACLHMAPGECWLFDNWRPHNVINAGSSDRVHLVIDLAGSSRFWRMVERAEGSPVSEVAYREAAVPQLLTERFNAAPVMAPGEVRALVRELIADFSRADGNDPELVSHYRRLLEDFALDWQEVWHRYGITAGGLPHYRQLIRRTTEALHPDRRALLTATNGVGVNPVVMQRILRPALAPELFDEFTGRTGPTVRPGGQKE